MCAVKIGWGRREISTTDPVSIPGQMHIRVSEGIHDPLYVTAMCVDGGEGQDAVVFVSCDIVWCFDGILEPIREILSQRRPEIPVDSVILNATHTHSSIALTQTPEKSPDGIPIYPGEKTRDFFCEMVAQAVIEAWDGRTAGGIAYGYGYAVVGHSRRVVYFKDEKLAQNTRDLMTPPGYAVMYGKTNNPLFSHYEAGADHFLNLMFTFDPQQKLTGIVVNVPCPSQLSGQFTMLSADYWNEVRAMVANTFGKDVYVLPQCAAAGDIAPVLGHYHNAQARRIALKYGLVYDPKEVKRNNAPYYNRSMGQRYDAAEQIMMGIEEVYAWAKKDIRTDVPVRHAAVMMPLERRKITGEEYDWCQENLKILAQTEPNPEEMPPEEYRYQKSRHNSAVKRNLRGIRLHDEVEQEPSLDVPHHIVQIGDVAFATTRFELFMDFMHRLQARSPFIQTFVIQLAGAEGPHYLATERAVEAKGYSASMFCNIVSANGGQQWVENTLDVLNQMKEKDET